MKIVIPKYPDNHKFRCQFCEKETNWKRWKNDKCPSCKKKYSWLMAQDYEDEP